MWFFENTRALGIVFLLVGFLMLVSGIIYIAATFVDLDLIIPSGIQDPKKFWLVTGIGMTVAALIYILFAHRVMIGKITDKLDIVATYVMMVGITTCISSVAEGIAEYVGGGSSDLALAIIIVSLIIGLIVTVIGTKINNGKKGRLKKALRWILIIAFTLMLIGAFSPAYSLLDLLSQIEHLILAIFLLIIMFDVDVKIRMGA
jgi:hypothetical protein